MKTTVKLIRVVFIIVMLGCITALSSYSMEPVKAPGDHLQKIIKEGITYPEQAVKNCCTGSVYVTFTVNEDGTINILNTLADNEHVDKMVKDQLSKICCKGVKVPSFARYEVKITFTLI